MVKKNKKIYNKENQIRKITIFVTLILTIICGIMISGCEKTKNNNNITTPNETNQNNQQNNQNNYEENKKTLHCYTYDKKQAVIYTYYKTTNEIYIKTEVNGSTVERAWKNGKLCIKSEGKHTCIDDTNKELYSGLLEEFEMNTKTLSNIMKIKCEEVPYKESYFIIN